ncbi:MAG: nitronate monooxygenase [Spirochaetales bacterium]|nr:nitronate monooxygenase [Spirochaetales bacterium]
MKIPELKIGNITIKIPIVQGGMGVKVSLSSLASAVTNAGGMGTISSIGLGDIEKSKNEFEKESREALVREIRKARTQTDGYLAVNIMGVLSNAEDLVITAVKEGIKFIVYGAGIPFRLPAIVPDSSVNLIPIISSARVVKIILKNWDRTYNRIPAALILEGPHAGGHLGFSLEQLDDIDNNSLEKILPEVLEVIRPYEEKYDKKIPIITAGGIYTGSDIARMLSLGASGVQMATRFVCTEECDVADVYKQAYINVKKEDIQIIKSPVGMPGRAIRNKFLIDLETMEKKTIKCPFRCLTLCDAKNAQYCIAVALVNSFNGDLDNGLLFCGSNAYRIDKIMSVKELFAELIAGIEAV